MRVLVACECSGIVRSAFRDAGHDAWSCDPQPQEDSGYGHIQSNVEPYLDEGWDLLIAHPPCTYLSNTGVHLLTRTEPTPNCVPVGNDRVLQMTKAVAFWRLLSDSDIPRIAIENPVPHKYAKKYISQYTQIVRPWQFGDSSQKGVCWWLQGLPTLVPTVTTKPERLGNMRSVSPSPTRQKDRSRFFRGMAEAMVNQWS